MALTKVRTGGIDAGAVTNTEVNASAAIVATKLGTLGTANMPTGSVLQVLSAKKTASQSVSNEDSFVDISGLSIAITPRATGSKIFVACNVSHSSTQNASGISFKVLRDSTVLGGSEGSRTSVSFFGGPVASDNNMAQTAGFNYLDSPSSTSALTYKVQTTLFNSGQTMYINTNLSRGGQIYDDVATSSITVMEVQG